jgi:hypothetical protein
MEKIANYCVKIDNFEGSYYTLNALRIRGWYALQEKKLKKSPQLFLSNLPNLSNFTITKLTYNIKLEMKYAG